MTSTARTLWDAVNDRIQAAINNTTTLQDIKSFYRGFRPKVLDGQQKPCVFTHLGASSDEWISNMHRQEMLEIKIFITVEIPDGDSDYIGELIELRDKLLNAIENNSSGTADISISNQLHYSMEISGNEITVSDTGNNATCVITYQAKANPYAIGAR